MKSKEYRLMQLKRINERYEVPASMFKRGSISFERLKQWQRINALVQHEIKKMDPTFGKPLCWQMVRKGVVS